MDSDDAMDDGFDQGLAFTEANETPSSGKGECAAPSVASPRNVELTTQQHSSGVYSQHLPSIATDILADM
jgi:hypothetical protein